MESQPQLITEQNGNLVLGIIGGAAAAAVGACIWAAITVATGYKIGWVAIGVGFLVGMAVRLLGKGTSNAYRIVGALFALLGCVAGNLFTVVAFVAGDEGIGHLDALGLFTPQTAVSALIETASPMDLLFYAIAIYEGFKLSVVPAAAPAPAGEQQS